MVNQSFCALVTSAGAKKVAENWEPEAKRQFGCKEHRLVALMLLLLHTDMSSHQNFPSYINRHKHLTSSSLPPSVPDIPDQPKDKGNANFITSELSILHTSSSFQRRIFFIHPCSPFPPTLGISCIILPSCLALFGTAECKHYLFFLTQSIRKD